MQVSVTEADHVWWMLQPKRLAFCDRLAVWRQHNAERRNLPERDRVARTPGEALALHKQGAPGEAGLMLYLTHATGLTINWNLYELAEPDIEGWIDVKTTPGANHCLLVKAAQKPELAYVLALSHLLPRLCFAGWAWGRDALARNAKGELIYERNPYRQPGREACFVPQGAPCFRPMAELVSEVLRRRAMTERASDNRGLDAAGADAPAAVKPGSYPPLCLCGGAGVVVRRRTDGLGDGFVWRCATHADRWPDYVEVM